MFPSRPVAPKVPARAVPAPAPVVYGPQNNPNPVAPVAPTAPSFFTRGKEAAAGLWASAKAIAGSAKNYVFAHKVPFGISAAVLIAIAAVVYLKGGVSKAWNWLWNNEEDQTNTAVSVEEAKEALAKAQKAAKKAGKALETAGDDAEETMLEKLQKALEKANSDVEAAKAVLENANRTYTPGSDAANAADESNGAEQTAAPAAAAESKKKNKK